MNFSEGTGKLRTIVAKGTSGKHSYVLHISYGPFSKSRHKVKTTHPKPNGPASEPETMYWIDGKPEWNRDGSKNWQGTDGGLPASEIYSFDVSVDGKPWVFPARFWHDCYEPGYLSATLSRDGKRLQIEMYGSDGDGSYDVIWRLRQGASTRRTFPPIDH